MPYTHKRKLGIKPMTIIKIVDIIFIIFFMGIFVFVHETTHQKIYSDFGVNSTIGVDWYAFTTIPNETEVKQLDDGTRNTMNFLQEETEITGYHAFPSYMVLVLIMMFVSRKRKGNKE